MSVWETKIQAKNTMKTDLYNSVSSAKDLSSEYGVSEVTIYAWIKKFSPIQTEDGDTVTADEIAKMKKPNAEAAGGE